MIAGVGIDLVEIERLRALMGRHGDAFLQRVLHPDENRDRLSKAEGAAHLAGLFAAKEAVMKALGTGMAGAAFSEIEISHHSGGQPRATLHGAALERATELGITSWQVSITHSRVSAAAVAIALR